MTEISDDLFVRLINHRVSNDKARWEDYLTECFAWLLRHDPALQARLLHVDGPVFIAEHSARALLAGEEVVVETQVDQGEAGRPDMQISNAAGFRLLVECKAGAPFDRRQVERYARTIEGFARGSVVAIVPRRTKQGVTSVPTHPRFLGILEWETVGEEVSRLHSAGEPIDMIRLAFQRLLREYNLVAIEETFPLPWDLDGEHQDVERVKRICQVFDRVALEVAEDRALMSLAPSMYQPGDDGAWRLGPAPISPILSGKGPSPRPVLTHCVQLPSRVHLFTTPLLQVHFMRLAAASAMEPSVTLDVKTGLHAERWYGEDAGGFLREILAAGGGVDGDQVRRLDDRAHTLMQAFQERASAMLERVALELRESSVVPDGWPRRLDYYSNQISLRLATTADLVGEEVDTRQLADRYRNLLVGTLEAFFASDPTQPFALLVAEACMPDMGRL